MNTSTIYEDNASIREQLSKFQKSVRKAVDEALRQAGHVTVDIHDSNSSFMLGMDLFGQETSVLERNVQEKLHELESELDRLVKHMDVDPVNNDENLFRQASTDEDQDGDVFAKEDPNYYQDQAQKLKQKIRFLQECSLARSALDESTTLATPALSVEPNWVEASQKLLQAGQTLEQAQSIWEQSELGMQSRRSALQAGYQILESLRDGIRRQRVELVNKATTIVETSITVGSDQGSDRNNMLVKSSAQLDQAYQVLECFDKEGRSALQDCMRRLTSKLVNDVLTPILDAHKSSRDAAAVTKPWNIIERSDHPSKSLIGAAASNRGPVHRIEWNREGEKASEGGGFPAIEAWKITLALVEQILTYFQTKVLLERESLCLLVGQRLFGKPDALPSSLRLEALGLESTLLGTDNGWLMETLIDLFTQTCIPKYLEPSRLHELASMEKELLSFCVPFCESMVNKKFIVFDANKPPRLVEFCKSFEEKYVDNRRCIILNEARDVLVDNDYHNTVVVGVDPGRKDTEVPGLIDGMDIFLLHKSSVSDTSSKIIALVRKAMDEAVAQPANQKENTPLSLLAPTLYRTAREILTMFRAIIPASHGSEIAHVPRTAAVLHNDCVYLAHHCLTLGLEYKEKFPEPQDARGKLLQQTCIFVDMVPLFRELADQSLGDMLELQKNQIADIVGNRITLFGKALASDESLHEWSEAETALAAGIYHIRHLVQAWKPILSAQVFCRSVGYLADAIFSLYLNQVHQASDISSSGCNFCAALFARATKEIGRLMENDTSGSQVWEHFDAVGKFMDMSLSEIEAALTNGVFRQVGGQELSKLIKAAFDDTPKRRALLNVLSNV